MTQHILTHNSTLHTPLLRMTSQPNTHKSGNGLAMIHGNSLTMYLTRPTHTYVHYSLTHSYVRMCKLYNTNLSYSHHVPPSLKQAHKQYWKWYEWRHNFQAASSKWPVSRTDIRGHTIARCTRYIHVALHTTYKLKFSRARGKTFSFQLCVHVL